MNFLEIATQIADPVNVLLVLGGCLFGIVVGAIPGLSATMAIALLVPFTYNYDILPATALLLGIYCGGMYGGVISALLLRVPGVPANAATMLDGVPMVERGEADRALSIATLSSGIGGIISVVVLACAITSIAPLILQFSTEEYFVLTVFGIVVIATLSRDSLARGLISAVLGLALATVGLDPVVPVPRFTFGVPNMLTGFPVVPALIGLFCVAQGFSMFEKAFSGGPAAGVDRAASLATNDRPGAAPMARRHSRIGDIIALRWTILRSALIGTFLGIVPAAGPNVASFFSYSEARRWSRNPERFGKGAPEGVAATEAANNAVPAGALLPALSFGIPGDTVTAILLGAFMLQGYAPGPLFVRDNPEEIWTMMGFLMIANIGIIVLGLVLMHRLARLIYVVPPRLICAVICVFGIAGGFAYSGQVYEALIAVSFGLLGYAMEKTGYPVVPLSIALLLGPQMETYFRQSLIANSGSYAQFFTRPICNLLWLIVVASLWSGLRGMREAKSAYAGAKKED